MNDQTWLDVFLVIGEDRFFGRSKSGAIWGTIDFQIGDNQFFPGKGRTDLVAAFVAGWLDGLLLVTTGTVENQRVQFFDSPFADRDEKNPPILLTPFTLHGSGHDLAAEKSAPGKVVRGREHR